MITVTERRVVSEGVIPLLCYCVISLRLLEWKYGWMQKRCVEFSWKLTDGAGTGAEKSISH